MEVGAFRRNEGEFGVDFVKCVFVYVFGLKIEGLLLKDDMWKMRFRLKLLKLVDVGLDCEFVEIDLSASSARRAYGLMDFYVVWFLIECVKVFVSVIV